MPLCSAFYFLRQEYITQMENAIVVRGLVFVLIRNYLFQAALSPLSPTAGNWECNPMKAVFFWTKI
jgi:hypothetical protein